MWSSPSLCPGTTFVSNIYINDLPNIANKLNIFLSADDTNIFFESPKLHEIEKTVNKELIKLNVLLNVIRLALNISKTNFVIFVPCE